jgi:hypothetical protein
LQDPPIPLEDNLKPGSSIVLIPTTTAHVAKDFAWEAETVLARVVAQPCSENALGFWMHNG